MAEIELRGKYAPGPKITRTVHESFGWKVDQQIMDIGSSIVVTARSDINRADATNITFYVRGRVSYTGENQTWPDRVAGSFSGDRPVHPGGILTIKAIEETEFWCFNYYFNRRALPVVDVFRFPVAGTLSVPLNQKILVCRGQVEQYTSGLSFEATSSLLNCSDNTYGFLIEAARETN